MNPAMARIRIHEPIDGDATVDWRRRCSLLTGVYVRKGGVDAPTSGPALGLLIGWGGRVPYTANSWLMVERDLGEQGAVQLQGGQARSARSTLKSASIWSCGVSHRSLRQGERRRASSACRAAVKLLMMLASLKKSVWRRCVGCRIDSGAGTAPVRARLAQRPVSDGADHGERERAACTESGEVPISGRGDRLSQSCAHEATPIRWICIRRITVMDRAVEAHHQELVGRPCSLLVVRPARSRLRPPRWCVPAGSRAVLPVTGSSAAYKREWLLLSALSGASSERLPYVLQLNWFYPPAMK